VLHAQHCIASWKNTASANVRGYLRVKMTIQPSKITPIHSKKNQFVFEQIHLDVARNATDDFNLFHDKNKWQTVRNNPFNGPILLGFQLEAFIIDKITELRSHENPTPKNTHLYDNYQFVFAGAIQPGDKFELNINKTRNNETKNSLSNRVYIKNDERLVITGQKKDTDKPLYLRDAEFSTLEELAPLPDKSLVLGGQYFMKKKFIMTSNAKNFLTGCLIEQSDYIDEVENKVNFPSIFPCSFISSALLEKARLEGINFSENPSVYTQHKISINNKEVNQLRSNSPLYILIENKPFQENTQLNCFGLTHSNNIVFRSIISLAEIGS